MLVRARGHIIALIPIVGLLANAPFVDAQAAKQAERETMYRRYVEFSSKLRPPASDPHWMADGYSFWYAVGPRDSAIIYVVDPKANTTKPLFDVARLRQALTRILGHEPPYRGIPFDASSGFASFTFLPGEKAVKFAVGQQEFVLQLDSYSIAVLSQEQISRLTPRPREILSPDGRLFAGVRDYNIYLRSTVDGRTTPLTTDGTYGYNWDYDDYFEVEAKWSPDGHRLAVMKMDSRLVDSIPFVHLVKRKEGTEAWMRPKEEVEWQSWRWYGPWETNELFIVDIVAARTVHINTGAAPDEQLLILGWQPDGSALYFLRTDRALKKLELMAADPATGAARTVVTETQQTFVGGWQLGGSNRYQGFTLLHDGKRFLWMAERDGWNHLYLYNADGSLIRRLTQGEYPVERVVAVDEMNGWVYFTAHADRQRPYDTHLYRVSLEGTHFTRLTATSGQHGLRFSPSNEFFVDRHSAVDRPGVLELRTADGTLLQTLARQSVDGLAELKWRPPEEFVVKAADGKTDLYGAVYKPYDFDPNKQYPVLDFIYADECCQDVPQTFAANFRTDLGGQFQAMAQLGFVTFVVDARGGPSRGKAFLDATYGNWGRAEILDHVATLKQIAGQRRYMDMSRVGIVGYSTGGYSALRAMLLAPEVYTVGVAGADDLVPDVYRKDADEYNAKYGSNLLLAGNLKGKLLLIHGTDDHNVPFSDEMRMADALIRAGKYFDLIVLPGESHGSVNQSSYVRDAVRRYLQERLNPE